MSINSHERRIPTLISHLEKYSDVPTYVHMFLCTYVRTTWSLKNLTTIITGLQRYYNDLITATVMPEIVPAE
jgi:hypothetical protein